MCCEYICNYTGDLQYAEALGKFSHRYAYGEKFHDDVNCEATTPNLIFRSILRLRITLQQVSGRFSQYESNIIDFEILQLSSNFRKASCVV